MQYKKLVTVAFALGLLIAGCGSTQPSPQQSLGQFLTDFFGGHERQAAALTSGGSSNASKLESLYQTGRSSASTSGIAMNQIQWTIHCNSGTTCQVTWNQKWMAPLTLTLAHSGSQYTVSAHAFSDWLLYK